MRKKWGQSLKTKCIQKGQIPHNDAVFPEYFVESELIGSSQEKIILGILD
jgi:hypothetical protein